MTDNELLQAISDIVQSQIEPIKKDIQELKSDGEPLMTEVTSF